MKTRLRFAILSQPDNTTCGPTCLQSIYGYHGDRIELGRVVDEVPKLDTGGTLAVHMANHALERGYRARIYTYDLQTFDPTWFHPPLNAQALAEKLEAQAAAKPQEKLRSATRAYLSFLKRGGELRFQDLTTGLIRSYLKRGIPLLVGLSSTYLYACPRETGIDPEYDDVRGDPSGHFVVLCGYDARERNILVADPLYPNPFAQKHLYELPINRVIASILLGIVTQDANILVLEPKRPRAVA